MRSAPDETVPGTAVPNDFVVDRVTMDAMRSAAVESRVQFGPRSRARITFRASELGNLINALDADGNPAGCGVKVFNSFYPELQAAEEIDADAALNFARGDMEEEFATRLLRASKTVTLLDTQVRLGAWTPCRGDSWCPDIENPTCGVSGFVHADERFPDQSGGRVRGKADFRINHPTFGEMPLEWKSTSSYAYKSIFAVGAKPENNVQGAWYGYEARTSHYAVGYTEKETGQLVVLVYRTPREWIEGVVFPACDVMRENILNARVPPRPEGTRRAEWANPPGSRRAGNKLLPDDPFYDKVWPCHTYGSKKDRAFTCPGYTGCHGEAPPTRPASPTTTRSPPRRASSKPAYTFEA